jgi:hypothetical protein
MALTEPAVALTDFGLAVECAVLVLLLARQDASDRTLRFWFVVFFGSAGCASLLGGAVHGFFPDADSETRRMLWRATLVAVLVTSLATWNIGGDLLLTARSATTLRRLAILQLLIFAFIVIFVRDKFYIAIIAYLPATLLLLIGMIAGYRSRRLPALRWGILGLSLTFVAAAVQRLSIAIHPRYFDHNALYHVIQGAALWMIFLGARAISSARPSIRRIHAHSS